MDKESRKLKQIRPIKLKRAGSSINKEDPEIDYRGYISLKDVLTSSSSTTTHVMNNDENMMINSSNISIKNVLVKHAASAYVQSAFLVQRDTNCLTTLLERIRDPTSCGSCCVKAMKNCKFHIFTINATGKRQSDCDCESAAWKTVICRLVGLAFITKTDVDDRSAFENRRTDRRSTVPKFKITFGFCSYYQEKSKTQDQRCAVVSGFDGVERRPYGAHASYSDGGVMVFLLGRRVDCDVSGMVELRPLGNISNSLPFWHICFSLGSSFSALGVGSKRMGYVTRSRAFPFYLK
ncbi:hypothetical protein L1887_37793 [Cichorium endivia]|nr:hypothetical protein L1887_37793 [Cichorium endivia]